jgi:hypothetical protein
MNVPPSIYFSGDQNRAISLKSSAMQFYKFVTNQADIGGVAYISRTLPLSDGSLIKITSFKESNYSLRTGNIIIFGAPVISISIKALTDFIYLESGFTQYSYFPNNEEAYKPGVFKLPLSLSGEYMNGIISSNLDIVKSTTKGYLNRGVVNEMTVDDYGLFSSSLVDGERSCSTGDPYSQRLSTSYPVDGYPIFTGPDYTFNSNQFLTKRLLMDFIPGSLFTGKTKLLVQSIYGSNRNDIIPYIEKDALVPTGLIMPLLPSSIKYDEDGNLILNPLKLTPYTTGYNTIFIKNNSNIYHILLMEINQSAFRVWELTPVGYLANKLLQDYSLFINTDEQIKTEAYILSTCFLSGVVVNWSKISGDLTGGFFPVYSWKFNNSGTEGVGTFHNPEYALDGNRLTITKKLLNITSLYNSNDELSVTITSSGSNGVTFSSYTTPIWAVSIDGLRLEWKGGGAANQIPPDTTQSGTIYSYYQEDNLVDITLSQNKLLYQSQTTVSQTPTSQSTVTNLGGYRGAIGITPSNSQDIPVNFGTASSIKSTSIYEVPDQPIMDNIQIAPIVQYAIENGWYLGGQIWSKPGFPSCYSYCNQRKGGSTFTTGTQGNTKNSYQALVIPAKDASSLLVYSYESDESFSPAIYTDEGVFYNPSASKFEMRALDGSATFAYDIECSPTISSYWGGSNTTSVKANHIETISASVHLMGSILDSEKIDEVVPILDNSEMLKFLYRPWLMSDGQELPVPYSIQAIKESWRTRYYTGDGFKENDFPGQTPLGWA